MGDSMKNIEVEKLISYSDDLANVLKDKRDVNTLTQCLQHSNYMLSFCNANFEDLRSSLVDYQKKIDEYKQKTEEARSEATADAELDLLQPELEEELEEGCLLGEELRMLLSMFASVTNIVPDLDDQLKISGYIVEKDKSMVKKFEFDWSKMTTLDVCNDIWKMANP